MKQKYSLGQLDGKQKDNREDATEKLGIQYIQIEFYHS